MVVLKAEIWGIQFKFGGYLFRGSRKHSPFLLILSKERCPKPNNTGGWKITYHKKNAFKIERSLFF